MTDFTPPDFTLQDSATYKANIDSGLGRLIRRNAIVNGDFSLWRRGLSFSTDGYGAERWRLSISDGAGTADRQAHTPGQVAVPGEPEFFYRHDQTSAATAAHEFLEQRMARVRSFAGLTVSVGLWAKAAVAADYNVILRQHFGSGGSPSADAGPAAQTVSIGTVFQRHTLSFAVPSISGQTIGTNGDDYLALVFKSPGGVAFTFDISRVQLEEGPVATPFESRPAVLEELLASPTYQSIPAQLAAGDLWIGFPVPTRGSAPSVLASVGTVVASTRLGALINHNANAATVVTVEDEL